MKKCTKCGTILDDSKKKCYMCGMDFQKKKIESFGETFDKSIGAMVTQSQDNVFNNTNDISVKMNDVVKSNDSLFSKKGTTSNFYDSVNFTGENPKKIVYNTKSGRKGSNITKINNTNANSKSSTKNNINKLTKTNDEKKINITFGNDLKNNNMKKNDFKVNKILFFNIICSIIFFAIIGYVYFNHLRPLSNEDVSFGGLKYTIDDKFILKSKETNSNYYIYDEYCAIRVNYGPTSNVDSFIDNYFDGIKKEYESMEGFSTLNEEIKINDNLWSSLSIVELQKNSNNANGYSNITKYKYITIVYNGNFYDIKFANLNNDSECIKMFNNFTSSLSLD